MQVALLCLGHLLSLFYCNLAVASLALQEHIRCYKECGLL